MAVVIESPRLIPFSKCLAADGELCTGAQIEAVNQHLCCCIRCGNGTLYLMRPLLFTEEWVEI